MNAQESDSFTAVCLGSTGAIGLALVAELLAVRLLVV